MAVTRSASTAKKPDLDWSQVRETINMLTLAVSQIECTMSDGEKSVAELTQSFTYIAGQLQSMTDQNATTVEPDPTSSNDFNSMKDLNAIKASTNDIREKVVSAIIAFQFYDRLSQRLGHVKRDLSWLSELVGNPQQLYNPEAWHKLQQDIMSNYSMEEERIMFQHIMNGASVEDALNIYRHHFNAANNNSKDESADEVELF